MSADLHSFRKRTPSISTRSTSSRSNATFGPPRSISDFNCPRCSDRSWPLRRMRAPRLPEISSIFSILPVHARDAGVLGLSRQDDAELGFSAHHARVAFGGLCERKLFDHGAHPRNFREAQCVL